jgi:oligosaccharyltransferase complex subunit beta
MVALSTTHTPMTSLAAEFSLILPPPGTPLVSHFPLRDGPANIIPIDVPKSHPILTSTIAPVWFSGIPHALGSNPYLVPILKAPSESFAADANEDLSADALTDAAEKGGEGLWAGQSLSVVSGFQTKSNSRVLWVGGVEMFTNAFMDKMTLA